MIRVFIFLFVIAVIAVGAAWLADRPGAVTLDWQGWRVETSLMVLAIGVAAAGFLVMALWSLVHWIAGGPAHLSDFFRARRRDKGLRALSRGMIATGAGDARLARHHAAEARRLMRGEPLTLLLDAQSAQLAGDRRAARRAFEAMLEAPDTELLGLRGLYVEAQRSGDDAAARDYAARASARAPALGWASGALLEFHTREGDWAAALATVRRDADNGLVDKKRARRLKAVLLAARAMENEDAEPDLALAEAAEAHKLAPELIPAAVVAGRLNAAAGQTRAATRIVERTWKLAPHPDLAEVYAHARPGDSARDRLKRVQALAAKSRHGEEGAVAVAVAAIDARDWQVARRALEPQARRAPTRRVCQLMAEIEDGERGDAGRVREWLSRALRARRDPAWVADGYVSDHWMPVSPLSGRLDAFEWTVPPEAIAAPYEDAAGAADDAADDAPPALTIDAAPAAPAPPRPEPAPEPEPEPEPERESETKSAPAPDPVATPEPPRPAKPPTAAKPAPAPAGEITLPRPPDDPGTDEESDRPPRRLF